MRNHVILWVYFFNLFWVSQAALFFTSNIVQNNHDGLLKKALQHAVIKKTRLLKKSLVQKFENSVAFYIDGKNGNLGYSGPRRHWSTWCIMLKNLHREKHHHCCINQHPTASSNVTLLGHWIQNLDKKIWVWLNIMQVFH